jgi:hypothetical protein
MKILLELKLLALAIFICQSLVGMEPEEEVNTIPCEVQFEQEILTHEEYQKWILEVQKEQDKIYKTYKSK